MLRADDFINVNVQHFEEETKRIAGLLSDLPNHSAETKLRLAREFEAIVTNSSEPPARRAQAAFLLGMSAEAFGIKHSRRFADSLVRVIESEFLNVARFRATNGIGWLESLGGMNLNFLKGLAYSSLAIDRGTGESVVEKLRTLASGSQFDDWLARLLKPPSGPK